MIDSVTKEDEDAGVRIITPEGDDLRLAIQFERPLSNNEAEYEVVLKAAQMLVAMNAEDIVIFTDSQLVAL